MATGYTSMLEEMDYDVPRWLKERAVRAMGVCATLRDDDWALSEKDIRKRLASFEDKDDYHERAVKEAERKLKAVGEKTQAEFKSEYTKDRAAAEKRYEKDLVEFTKKKAQYVQSLAEIDRLIAKAEKTKPQGEGGDVVTGTLRFAREQIESTIQFDFRNDGPYKDSILETPFDKWVKEQMTGPERDIAYHTKEIEQKAKRFQGGNRIDLYDAFVNFINRETQDVG